MEALNIDDEFFEEGVNPDLDDIKDEWKVSELSDNTSLLVEDIIENKPKETHLNKTNDKSLDTLSVYMKEITKYDLLSPEEEFDLWMKSLNWDLDARKILYLSNLRLVVRIANMAIYRDKWLDFIDRIQEWNIWLMKSLKKFDPRESKISTYWWWWIKKAIENALNDKWRIIRISDRSLIHSANFNKEINMFVREYSRYPTYEELLEIGIKMWFTKEYVQELLNLPTKWYSLNNNVNSDWDATFLDFFADNNKDVEIDSENKNKNEFIRKAIDSAIDSLPPRERYVLKRRSWLGWFEESTLDEIWKDLWVTRERIRQIEYKAKMRFKKFIKFKNPELLKFI